MPYCKKNKVIFIHIPKNAGTSVLSIPEFFFEGVEDSHMPAVEARVKLSEVWCEYSKYCIVRNPWDRFVSNFEYARMEKSYWHSSDGTTKYAHHPDFATVKNLTFENVVDLASESLIQLKHPGWKPQNYFVCDADKNLLVDKIFYSENLDGDREFHKLFPGLPRVNSSSRQSQNYRDYYNSKTLYKIYKLYHTDVTMFGFKY